MRFQPKTDEQIEQEQTFGDPFPRGEYDVMVKEAKDDISKTTNNEQIKLMVVITNDDGHRRTAFDYLLEAMPKKLKSFCDACGLQEEYESGSLEAAHCRGQEMRAIVDIEPAKGDYPAKNVIKQYLPRQAAQRTAGGSASAPANGTDWKRMAWDIFLPKWKMHVAACPQDASNRDENFHKAVTGVIPGKAPASFTQADWQKVATAIRVYDPQKGYPGKAPSQKPPFEGDTPVFEEADIPF